VFTIEDAISHIRAQRAPEDVKRFMERTLRVVETLRAGDLVLRAGEGHLAAGVQVLRGGHSVAWLYPQGRALQFRTTPTATDKGVELRVRAGGRVWARMEVTGASDVDVARDLLRRAVLDAAPSEPGRAADEEADVEAYVRPRRRAPHLSAVERRAIELRAVTVVREELEAAGWTVEDVGATRSYDLHCSAADGRLLHVEVKGTTGPVTSIMLTANEVELARAKHPRTALYVVHDINLTREPEAPEAIGGTIHKLQPWLPEDARLRATVFLYRLDGD
jgi:Domain of unknown function (DUF3883)